jgi:hypothetical protein
MKKRKVLPVFPHQFFYFLGLKIRKMMLNLSVRMVPPPMAVYEKAQGFWISRALVAACELNLADHLASGPKSIAELAILSHSDETNLYRLMRSLAGEKVFKEMPGRVFTNTPVSDALKEGDNSMKYMILQQFGETNMLLFSQFTECIRTGEGNAVKLLGKKVFEYLEDNPEKNENYNKAMDNSSGMVALALLSAYDFSGIKTMVDVGGGHGILLNAILEKHHDIKGILFDQGHVTDKAAEAVPGLEMHERIQIVSGSFFDDLPSGGDAYFMKNILHAFSDEDCLKILKKIHSVMADNGKLIILETVIRPGNEPSLGKMLDLLMMTGTEGGKERSREEFEDLLNRSGFALNRIIRTIAPFSVLEAGKK